MNNPDMSRKQHLAGQTVRQGCFAGRHAMLTSRSHGPGVIVDGELIPGEPIKRPGKPE